MKKTALLILILVSNFSNAQAQHCPYDGSSIIVLKVHTQDNQDAIPNLKVTLIKKKNDKIVKNQLYVFTQNNNFPFLSDEYSVIVGTSFDTNNWYVKIESFCEFGNNGWTNFGTAEIKIKEDDKFNLCGNYDATDYHTVIGERIYKPIEVILSKKDCE